MGLFGGSKSQSVTNNTSTVKDIPINNLDNRVVDGNGVIEGNVNFNLGEGILSNNNINVTRMTTDFGAINRAFDSNETAISKAFNFGDEALDSNENILNSAFSFGNDALDSNNDILNKAFDFADDGLNAIKETSEQSFGQLGKFVGDFAKTTSEDLNEKIFTFGTIAVVAFTIYSVVKK
jgi:hypothetical protein